MFKCFCWLFWSSETDFLNIYLSKAIDITRKTEIATTVGYTYVDRNWKDKLTAYNGKEISYKYNDS